MFTKPLVATIVASLGILSVAGATAPSSECDSAILEVQQRLARSGGAWEPRALDALQEAFRLCPAAQGDSAPHTLPKQLPVGGSTVLDQRVGTPSELCGFHDATTVGGVGDAPIGGFVQVGSQAVPVDDHGPAQGIYQTNPEQAIYEGRGTYFGFTSSNSGTGIIMIANVPFPATSAWAQVGCATGASSALCWGHGYAQTMLTGGLQVLTIQINGAFYACPT